MTGRIGDDELALGRRKKPVGHINGNALLALCLKPVNQKRKVEIFACRAMFAAVFFKRRQLVFEYQFRVVKQTPDECRLSVVHRAAGEKTQHGLAFLLAQKRRDLRIGDIIHCIILDLQLAKGGHQKYPSRFFFSIEPASSLSMALPCRSEVLAISISRTISDKVAASDSMAPVSG